MRKSLFLPIGILTLSLISLASCNLAHKHQYGSSWEKDGTHHWHTCEGANCSGISDKAEHTGGTATETEKAKCEVCGESYGSLKSHEHAYTVSKVDAKYLVSEADCDSKAIYKKSCECGEVGTETFESGEVLGHNYADAWISDKDNHWHVCEREGCNGTSEKISHTGGTATEIEKAKCEVCGNEYGSVLPHTHVYSEEVVHEDYLVSVADCDSKAVYYKSCGCGEKGTETFEHGEVLGHDYDTPKTNSTHHWDECSCGEKANVEAHEYVVNKDSTHHWKECDCGKEIEKVEHDYTYTYTKDNQTLKYSGICSCGHTVNGDVTNDTLEVSNEVDLKMLLSSNYNVVLSNDITLSSPIVLDGNIDVSIDLNNHSLSLHKETPTQTETVEVFLVQNNAKLTIDGEGEVTSTVGDDAPQGLVKALSAVDGSKVVINNGSFYSNGCDLIFATRGAVIDIYGGSFEASKKWNGLLFTLNVDETLSNSGVINVYGGSFIEFDPSNDTVDSVYPNKVVEGYCSIKVENSYVVDAHIIVIDKAVAVGCETNGLTEGSHCSRCNHVFVVQEPIEATGHKYPEGWINSKDGKSHEISCYNCGLVSATELHYGGTPSTTNKAICIVCGLDYNEKLPPQQETTISIADYASENNWENATKYSEISLNGITISIEGGGNSGKYYTSETNWRLYQTENAKIVISVENGTILSVTITYTKDKNGVLTYEDSQIQTGTEVDVNKSSITFGTSNAGEATNGQVRITNILVIHQENNNMACPHSSFEYTYNLSNSSHSKVCLSCETIISTATCLKINDADCTTDATCICGRIIEEKWGHSYSSWTQLSPKNCEKAEILGRECYECKTKETKEGEAATGHNMEFDLDDEQHWKICKNGCGTETDAEDHFGGLATPSEKAVCVICNNSYGEKSDHIHTFTSKNATSIYQKNAETCTEEGDYYYSCEEEGCDLSSKGTPVEDTFTVDALGHDFSKEWTTDNNNHWHVCEREGCEETTTKLPHSGGNPTPTEKAVCEDCDEPYGELQPVAATFEFGSNNTVAEGADGHKDGSEIKVENGYSESSNGYTLELDDFSKVYTKSYDTNGNSCLKFGKSGEAGTCSFTVSDDINLVIIYIAKYKENKSIVTINGEIYELENNSTSGEYDIIEIDTSTEKTITITTEKGGYRAMLNTIKFYK